MLALALLVLVAGAVMVTSGVADPEGGPLGMLGDLVKGKAPTVKAKTGGSVLDYAPALLDTPAGTGGGGGGGTVSTGTTSGTGAGIVATARKELGKPYQWGGSGPDRWDCSGLVWHSVQVGAGMAWKRLPAELQRTSKLGTTIAASSARAGDIVFFGIPASHCGIYIGGGQMIAAPQTGSVVKVQSATVGQNKPFTYRRFPASKSVAT